MSVHSSRLQGAGYIVEQLDLDAKIDRRAITLNGAGTGLRRRGHGGGPRGAAGIVRTDRLRPPRRSEAHQSCAGCRETWRCRRRATDISLGYSVRGREAMSGADDTPLTPAERTRQRSLSAELTFEESDAGWCPNRQGQHRPRHDHRATTSPTRRTRRLPVSICSASALTSTSPALADGSPAQSDQRARGGAGARHLAARISTCAPPANWMNRASSAVRFPTSPSRHRSPTTPLISSRMATFSGFDPASISGNDALKGQIAGTADVDATVAGLSGGVTIDAVAGDLNLTLEPSKVGDLVIDRAVVDAQLPGSKRRDPPVGNRRARLVDRGAGHSRAERHRRVAPDLQGRQPEAPGNRRTRRRAARGHRAESTAP